MDRYIVRYRGRGTKPADDVEQLRRAAGVRVLDDTSPFMLLVEAEAAGLEKAVGALDGWEACPQRAYRVPDPRPKPRGPG